MTKKEVITLKSVNRKLQSQSSLQSSPRAFTTTSATCHPFGRTSRAAISRRRTGRISVTMTQTWWAKTSKILFWSQWASASRWSSSSSESSAATSSINARASIAGLFCALFDLLFDDLPLFRLTSGSSSNAIKNRVSWLYSEKWVCYNFDLPSSSLYSSSSMLSSSRSFLRDFFSFLSSFSDCS